MPSTKSIDKYLEMFDNKFINGHFEMDLVQGISPSKVRFFLKSSLLSYAQEVRKEVLEEMKDTIEKAWKYDQLDK